MGKDFTIPEVGDMLAGRYRIEDQLGRGGFGIVFRATQLGLDRQVAIKTLLPSAMAREDIVERFRREAMLARNLNHPNTIRIYDFGETEGNLLYIVMEYLDGRTLGDVLKEDGPLDTERVQRIAGQILKSLAEAHQHGVIHRDLKPANIMLQDVVGEPDFVKVLDFGIAKAFDDRDEQPGLTQTGMGFGTAQYMGPEQIKGKGVGPGTDLYALGLVMAEMLTSQAVFQADSVMQVAVKQLSADPAPITSWVLRTPLGPLIQRATQKNVDLRYPSAVEMLRDLRSVDPRASIDISAQIATVAMDAIKPGTPNPYAQKAAQQSSKIQVPTNAADPPKRSALVPLLIVGTLVLLAGVGLAAFLLVDLLDRNKPQEGGDLGVVALEEDASKDRADLPARDETKVMAEIKTIPEGAEIYRGEEYMGTTPVSLPLERGEGTVKLKVTLEGFYSHDLEASRSQDKTYNLDMEVKLDEPAPDAGPADTPPTEAKVDKVKTPAKTPGKAPGKAPAKGQTTKTPPKNPGPKTTKQPVKPKETKQKDKPAKVLIPRL